MLNSDLVFFSIIIFVFLIIFGIYLSEFTPLKISEKERILAENFSNPMRSTSVNQTKGASQLYKWGYPEDPINTTKKEKCDPIDPVPPFVPIPPPPPIPDDCREEKECIPDRKPERCYRCDITTNKDIDKYVLKSSVPPCPDVSRYATKNMIQSCPDISKYILKSEIPACRKIDHSKYILKSNVPACPKCPICPVCPVCPVCPKPQKQITINQYKISEHKDFKDYVHKDQICKYIKDNQLCKKPPSPPPPKPPTPPPPKPPTPGPDEIDFDKEHKNSTSNLQGSYVGDRLYALVPNKK